MKKNSEEKKRSFAETLRKYRLDHNISQEELARLIGTSVFSVSRWERAKHYPPNSTLRLMRMIGVL